MIAEVQTRAAFSKLRYAQCWEDADILLAGLDVQPGDSCFSIASAGEIPNRRSSSESSAPWRMGVRRSISVLLKRHGLILPTAVILRRLHM